MTDSDKKPYYEVQAFRPDNIPKQRSLLRAALSSACSRLMPWGSTQQTASMKIFEDCTPKSMRFWEEVAKEKEAKKANGTYVPAIFEGVDLHDKCDNECFRFAPLPFTSQFWLVLLLFPK
nr:hypothetical protein [Pseudomonas syringae]